MNFPTILSGSAIEETYRLSSNLKNRFLISSSSKKVGRVM
jgi:hypothetical protein